MGTGKVRTVLAGCVLTPVFSEPAIAQEVFAGIYAHAVDTPFTLETGEEGVDLAAGYRFPRLEKLRAIGRPSPYLVASVNTRGDTSFAGAGLSWKIGEGRWYVRPGLGLVVHDGPSRRFDPASGKRTDLGSRVLFEPEIALGVEIDKRLAVEASWMHISHATLFSGDQNPGIDFIGLRLNWALR